MTSILPKRRSKWLRSLAAGAIATITFCLLGNGVASAYVGESFLQVPGLAGGLSAGKYKGWVLFEARYWNDAASEGMMTPQQLQRYKTRGLNAGGRVGYSGTDGPRQGAGKLNLALDKHSPALKPLMDLCASKASIPELTYAESAELSRPSGEWGDRPADIPQFYEYKLKNVQMSCPELATAPEQAIVLSFADIELTNYKGSGQEAITRGPAKLSSEPSPSGETKTYVMTFFGAAVDARPDKDQCPKMNEGATEADYYGLMTKEAADKERALLAGKGGAINGRDGYMFRGPDRLSACHLPGIVPDTGFVSPVSDVAHGFDMDGGRGPAHKKFVSEDGRQGIDNQLFSVIGCVPGLKRNGLLSASRTELMRNGTISMLVQVSGIHDQKNDKNVDVTILYSLDPMVRSSSGAQILPKYTFRVTDDPELAPDFARLRGRIENGVVITDPIKEVTIHDGGLYRVVLYNARLRLAFLPDGSMKGYIGGFQDWRVLYNNWGPWRHFESTMGFTCPGMYGAFKRAADGPPDPMTGERNTISAVYDIEAVPAFIPPDEQKKLALGEGGGER